LHIGNMLHMKIFKISFDCRKSYAVVVLPNWVAELHHILLLPLLKGKGGKYNEKGSGVEVRTGRPLNNYCDRQNRLCVGQLNKFITDY